jgi:hypothetical protein
MSNEWMDQELKDLEWTGGRKLGRPSVNTIMHCTVVSVSVPKLFSMYIKDRERGFLSNWIKRGLEAEVLEWATKKGLYNKDDGEFENAKYAGAYRLIPDIDIILKKDKNRYFKRTEIQDILKTRWDTVTKALEIMEKRGMIWTRSRKRGSQTMMEVCYKGRKRR